MQNEGNERQPLSSTGREMASRLQSIRDILTSDRDSGLSADEHRAALDVVDSEIAERLTTEIERDGTTYDNTLHRRVDNAVNDRYSYLLERHGSTSPSSIARSRRRLNRPLDRIQRQTDRMHRLARSDPQEQSSSNISQLSPLHPSRTRQASDDQDSDMDLHRSRDARPVRKRRKLDDGTADSVRVLLSYGVEGTLLPGNLSMIVLDLEGSFESQSPADQLAKARLFSPENKDAYRIKRHNCDILMKHSGGHPFALSKLIVKLPKRDHDAPPLQGMVFVSMNRETLISQASHYNSYYPFSHSFHKRRYDSYRPSVDYMRSARSPRPAYRPRHPSDHFPPEMPWYDTRHSLIEQVEAPSSFPGINVSLEPVIDPEDSPTYGSRSPRPWEPAHDYSRRPYIDRYRPSGSTRARNRSSLAALEIPPLTPTSSEDEEDDQDQDRSQSNPDDLEETAFSRDTIDRELDEARARQLNILEQMRTRQDRGDGYSYFPRDPPPQSRREHETHSDNDDGDETYSNEQIAAIEATLSRRGYDVDALRRRARGARNPATGANETSINTQISPPSIAPQFPHVHFHSTKRLPGCAVVPHATFSVGRDGGSGVAVNFAPEVSGIYILIKLWSVCPNSDVTVQNIIPVGFGTVRQMADIEFR